MPANNQHGFVLVLTLWVMVIVAIAAGYFAEHVARVIKLTQQSQLNTQTLIATTGTRADILYRLSTTSMSEYGLGNTRIHLDNRPYHGLGDTQLQLQDDRGLLNLNAIDDNRLQRFLGLMGIANIQHRRFIDTLRDFTDADKLHRLNGAEDAQYRAMGLPLPANRNLITPWEVKRIITWRTAPALWKNNRLIELVSTSASVGLNPNTAPIEILRTLPGLTDKMAQMIIARRKLSPITSEAQITAITGMSLHSPFGMGIIATPSNSIRVTLSALGLSWAMQYNITLTPNDKHAPWRTDYYNRINTPQRKNVKILPLPPRSNSAAAQAPTRILEK